ncbi:MAG: ATP-binding protein, partial [Bacteroidota bacterium]
LRTGMPVSDVVLGILSQNENDLRWLQINTLPIHNKKTGALSFVITTFHDVSGQMGFKKQFSAMETLEKRVINAENALKINKGLFAQISHEIKNPLATIIGMSELLADTKVNTEQKEYIDSIINTGIILKEIVRDILDYSKIEAGRLELKKNIFPLKNLIVNAQNLFNGICKKPIKFQTFTDKKLPEFILADELRIYQIISNLLSNAMKFTLKGKIILSMDCIEENAKPGQITIKFSVTDTGVGIPPGQQKKLFKPFSQVNDKQTLNPEGTGLGLSICKDLVEMQGGQIGVESTPGSGSTFWFTVPVEPRKDPALQQLPASISTDENCTGLNILVAEDRLLNQKITKLLLNSLGHEVTIASNGQIALEKFAVEKFDLIFLDIYMPVMDGITTAQILRENYQNLPPLIGLSGSSFDQECMQNFYKSLDGFFIKPLSKDNFKFIIKKYFQPTL